LIKLKKTERPPVVRENNIVADKRFTNFGSVIGKTKRFLFAMVVNMVVRVHSVWLARAVMYISP